MNDMEKVSERILFNRKILIGRTKATEWDKQRHPVFLKATIKEHDRDNKKTTDLKPIKKYRSLSISGSSKNFAGQIYDKLKEGEIDFTVPKSKVESIKRIWKKWHLNDLKAGTDVQEKAISRLKDKSYDKVVNYLKKKRLYHQNGYAYGSAWLVKDLPSNVEKKIKRLF